MAVVSVPQKTTLALHVQKGISGSGSPVYAYRNYTNVKPAAAPADIFDVAVALAGLQAYTLADIQRIDYANLISE